MSTSRYGGNKNKFAIASMRACAFAHLSEPSFDFSDATVLFVVSVMGLQY